jgi:hypothetical protein
MTPAEVLADDAQCRAMLRVEPTARRQRPTQRTNAQMRMTEPAISIPQPTADATTQRADHTSENKDSLYEPPESLCEPPGSVSSGGYVSPAVAEGMGSLGELVSSDGDGDLESLFDDLALSWCLWGCLERVLYEKQFFRTIFPM